MRASSWTLQSFYRRVPWSRLPLDAFDWLTTARHWYGFFGAPRGTPVLRPDSTRLSRALVGLTSPLRRACKKARAGSTAFQKLDWSIRKFVWILLWTATVAYRYRARRLWRPRAEPRIRMQPPTARHPDFKAPALRFPDTVPLAEASFGADLWVEALHLLQDVYPVAVPHLPRASDDPATRLAQCYPRLFRFIRESPRWHPDLAAAAATGNLLGALAVGGPFAKLLECVDATTGHYTIDLSHMQGYEVRDGLLRLGCRINYEVRAGQLVVTDIVYAGETVSPRDARWRLIEQVAFASLVTHLTVWRQGMEYHASGLAAYPAATHNMPPGHPIRRLLAPHMIDTASVSYYTHLTLRRSGFDVQGFAFPHEHLFRYYDDGARNFYLARLDIRIDQKRRGIPETLHYPYYPQALRYYEMFERYVRSYLEIYYPDEASLAGDVAARAWFEELDSLIINGIRGYVPSLDKENLVKLCTVITYSVVIGHDENSLWDYALFLPTLVHADGLPMTLGEVQCTSNFQLLICSAINDLMADFSHVALDERGANAMRQLQTELAALQAEMEAGADEYWRIYPRSLKSSVAC